MLKMFDEITSWGNLMQAFTQAARGKRRGLSAAGFEMQLADKLLALQDALRAKSYRPAHTITFSSTNPSAARSAQRRLPTESCIMPYAI